jgi:hypothetical protein
MSGLSARGRPLLWYLDGRKREAVRLLVGTLAILFAITAAMFSVLLFLGK